MTAVACDLGHVRVFGIPAVIAAIIIVAAYTTAAPFVGTLSVVSHNLHPLLSPNNP